jgi:uncharacterized membrane protein
MLLIAVLRTIHIFGAVLFLGAGLMTAYYKVRADRSGDPRVVAWYQREIVRADWLFTLPSGVILPVTGVWLALIYRLPWTTPWLVWGTCGFLVAGMTWVPAVWLQIRMRRLADAAVAAGQPLPPEFHRANRAWLALGVPAFTAALVSLWAMATQQVP